MEKYLNLKADHSMQGMTVEKILRKNMGLTKKQISRAKFRPDGICKNKIQCRVTEKISEGDEIRVCLETEDLASVQLTFNEKAVKLDIIYEDEDVLVVNKQAGILTHPSGMHYSDSLSNHVSAYFRLKGLSVCVRPVGRLDKETSGIVLFAKNQVAAQRLQEQRAKGLLEKQYLAITEGKLPIDQNSDWHTIDCPIRKTGNHPLRMEAIKNINMSAMEQSVCENPMDNVGYLHAVTHYRVLDSTDEWSVVNLKLDTGRTHQIRVHMLSIGHPLLGDSLYNRSLDKKELYSINRAALHAWKVSFYQPFTKNKIILEASLPEDFQQFYQKKYKITNNGGCYVSTGS